MGRDEDIRNAVREYFDVEAEYSPEIKRAVQETISKIAEEFGELSDQEKMVVHKELAKIVDEQTKKRL